MTKTLITLVTLQLLIASVNCGKSPTNQHKPIFPLGIHTWKAGEDYNNTPPTDRCASCPQIDLLFPAQWNLMDSGWELSIDNTQTTIEFSGQITAYTSKKECNSEDGSCLNRWQIWPSITNTLDVYKQNRSGEFGLYECNGSTCNFIIKPSFQCGKQRLVMEVENGSGLTRAILQINRKGVICDLVDEINDSLNIRLLWDQNRTDLDLHLIRPNGVFGDPIDDCNVDNCSAGLNTIGTSDLDWGVPLDFLDNPLLDVDDYRFHGPENITLHNIQPGIYKIAALYKSGEVGVVPTIEVWLDNELLKLITFGEISKMNTLTNKQIWYAGTIDATEDKIKITVEDAVD